MDTRIAFLAIFALLTGACTPSSTESGTPAETNTGSSDSPPYTADVDSLSKHQAAPEWFRDAKFGIYFTWGPYTVAAHINEWYPRWMHFDFDEGDWNGRNPGYHIDALEWHTEKFGHPSEFGYHDMIPLFTAENFDAAEWANLFAASGARYAGPVAIHHDGFALWDSDVTPWNAQDIGPKVDVLGELAYELRKRDMKVVATFHHARHLQRYAGMSSEEAMEKYGQHDLYHAFWNSHFPWIEGLATSSDDPELRLLYGNMPEDEWLEEVWLGMLKEVVDKYQPDMVWFDTWLDQIPESKRYEFAAYYLNEAEKWGKDVIMTHKHQDTPTSFSVLDLEKGRQIALSSDPWLTDDTISKGSWSYTDDLEIKTGIDVTHALIDTVAKNGQLLLNISPRYDGTIPDNQRAVLETVGKWLDANGEAIYATRPWTRFGEGPTEYDPDDFNIDGHFQGEIHYTAEDIRFTTKGDTLYAISLGTPEGSLTIKSLGTDSAGEIATVSALNGDFIAEWTQGDNGLTITLADGAPIEPAYAFRITTD